MRDLEPIRAVFRQACLYSHAADDLLCERLAEAVAWPTGALNRDETLRVLSEHNAWRRGASGEQTDPRILGLALDAVIAHLSAPQAPPAAPRVERYGDGVLVHWPEGVEQYVQVGDCVTGNLAAPPAALAVTDPPVMDLIGKYWDLAYTEGTTGVSQGNAANELLHQIRRALAPPAAVPAANVTPMRQPRADLARLVESINAAVYASGDGLSVTEAIGALELAKLELLREQEE